MEQGYSGVPLIELDGSEAGSSANGLVLSGGQSTVRGLVIVGFGGSAIVLQSQGNDVVAGNYLGVNASGNQADANGQGISIAGTSGNTIGGTTAAAANVISGNSGSGIVITDVGGEATGNEIAGNEIGTNASGSMAIANVGAGIDIVGASTTVIGLPSSGSGNIIAGNLGPGIEVSGNAVGTQIRNNQIGVAVNNTTMIANGADGIRLDNAPSTTIGGTGVHDLNVIGGNLGNGIETLDGTTALVEGNAIGTDPTGMQHLGNQGNGVQLASSLNTIGGATARQSDRL